MPTIIKSDPRAREKPCLRCGYSLRKLTDSTHCPECGLSVWLSLNQNDTLEWSSPEWLRKMVRGTLLMAGAQLLAITGYILYASYQVPAMQHRMRTQQAWEQADYDPAQFATIVQSIGAPPTPNFATIRSAILCAAAYLLLYHLGLFLLVSNEERYPDRLKDWRVAAWIVCGGAGLVSLMMVLWAISPLTLGLFGLGLKLVAIASGVVTWGYLRRLARRAPQPTLAKVCTWLMLAPLLSFLKVFPFIGTYLLVRLSWLVDLLPLAYIPVSAVLLVLFARLFSRAAASADKSWAAETKANE